MSAVKDIINAFVSIPKGLWVTLKNWSVLRPSVTELYPEEKPELPERYRGMPCLPADPETGRSACIACGACARICPEGIITVEGERTESGERRPVKFEIDISRCMFCGLCVEACPKDCLKPARTFELACRTREGMIYNLEDLLKLGETVKKPQSQERESPEGN